MNSFNKDRFSPTKCCQISFNKPREIKTIIEFKESNRFLHILFLASDQNHFMDFMRRI